MKKAKKNAVKKSRVTKTTTAMLATKKLKPAEKKKKKNLYGFRELMGIGLVNGKRPKRDTRPDKDIIWGD